jgi:hypothetical protein
MITPSTPIVIPATAEKIFDGIWIKNIQINAPLPTKPITANIMICPFNSTTGELSNNIKTMQIPDVYAMAATSSHVALAMSNIFSFVQEQVISKSLF